MPFADTHVHFHFPDFEEDRDAAIDAARKAGIELFVNVGTNVDSSRKSLEFAEKYPDFYAAAGIHPNDAITATPESMREIEELLKHPRMLAIGEIGLDYYRDHSPKDVQKKVLENFLALHKRINKPLIIHCRDAYDDLLEIFRSEKISRGIMHCFSSDRPTMEKFVEQGFYISFAGPLTYKKNDALREACKACPLDRLLFETDAPFLPPQSKRGKRNETLYMMETFQTGADLHNLPLQEIGKRTTENARRALGIS
jgi:TatD DNase family protein